MTLSEETVSSCGCDPSRDPQSPGVTHQDGSGATGAFCQRSEAGVSHTTPATRPANGKEGDVKSLLNFVNVASGDIRAALDKSAPLKRCVDHRKYLQRQLKRFTGSSSSSSSSSRCGGGGGGSSSIPSSDYQLKTQDKPGGEGRKIFGNGDSVALTSRHSQLEDDQSQINNSVCSETDTRTCHLAADVKDSDEHRAYLVEQQQNIPSAQTGRDIKVSPTEKTTSTMAGVTTPTPDGAAIDTKVKAHKVTSASELSDPLFEKLHVDVEKDDQKTTPLRQRQLPASFWKEPCVPKTLRCPEDHVTFYDKYGSHLLSPGLYKDMLQGVYPSCVTTGGPYGFMSTSDPHRLTSVPVDYFYQTLNGKYNMSASVYTYPWNYGTPVGGKIPTAAMEQAQAQTVPPYGNSAFLLGSPRTQRTNVHTHGAPASAPTGQAPAPLGTHPLGSWTPPSGCIAGTGHHKPPIWRPIPTKTVTSYSGRYHPFVH